MFSWSGSQITVYSVLALFFMFTIDAFLASSLVAPWLTMTSMNNTNVETTISLLNVKSCAGTECSRVSLSDLSCTSLKQRLQTSFAFVIMSLIVMSIMTFLHATTFTSFKRPEHHPHGLPGVLEAIMTVACDSFIGVFMLIAWTVTLTWQNADPDKDCGNENQKFTMQTGLILVIVSWALMF
eukprot:PhF_6_TR38708/c0_g1_i2/m.57925